MMRAHVHLTLMILSASILATGAATVSYLAFQEFRPSAAQFETFASITPLVTTGGIAKFKATYQKRFDCAGRMLVDLDEAGHSTGRVIHEQALGNREPGRWEIVREYKIPADSEPGPARLREVLIYDCRGRIDVIRSPWAEFIIEKNP